MSIKNIIFMGTPIFAVESLKKLHENFNVTAVITQPDKKSGRGQKISISPVKEFALSKNIPVVQPNTLKNEEFMDFLKKENPDLIVVVAYGKILPESILNFPKYGCINVHGSLLPRWRGAAPIHWSIIEGDKKTGVTIMYMDKGLDTGDMILKKEILINDKMTTSELHDIMMKVGAEALVEALFNINNGKIIREKQDDKLATYASMLNNDNTQIDFNKSSTEIVNLIRGLNSWPKAYTHLDEKIYKVLEAEISTKKGNPGEIISFDKNGILVGTKDSSITIKKIQPPNKGIMEASAFINGNKDLLVKHRKFEMIKND